MSQNWDGKDPELRALRAIAFFVISVLLFWTVVIEPGSNDLGAIGTLLGALLVLLGFEVGMRWPGGRK